MNTLAKKRLRPKRITSLGYKWYQWCLVNIPTGMRGVGTRQLFILYSMANASNGSFTTLTKGDTAICETLWARGAVEKLGLNRYAITPEGRRTFSVLRGSEYYKSRGL